MHGVMDERVMDGRVMDGRVMERGIPKDFQFRLNASYSDSKYETCVVGKENLIYEMKEYLVDCLKKNSGLSTLSLSPSEVESLLSEAVDLVGCFFVNHPGSLAYRDAVNAFVSRHASAFALEKLRSNVDLILRKMHRI